MLFGVPVPEEYSLNKAELDEIIKEALNSAKERDIIGKEITPFLLGHVAKVTEGKSLTTSILFILFILTGITFYCMHLTRMCRCSVGEKERFSGGGRGFRIMSIGSPER